MFRCAGCNLDGERFRFFFHGKVNGIARVGLAFHNFLRQGVLDVLLNGPGQRTGSVLGVESFLTDKCNGVGIQGQLVSNAFHSAH